MNKKQTKNEKIEAEFSNIIREQLTDKQFWNWVSGWLDSEDLCERAEDWPIETKIEELKDFKKILKKK